MDEKKLLKIIDIKDDVYTLKDEDSKRHVINLKFWDLDVELQMGDKIYINAELLNPKYDGYSTWYEFGNLDNKYGKAGIQIEDIDVIKILKNGTDIYMKRLYG